MLFTQKLVNTSLNLLHNLKEKATEIATKCRRAKLAYPPDNILRSRSDITKPGPIIFSGWHDLLPNRRYVTVS
jgi:hypothetical protein